MPGYADRHATCREVAAISVATAFITAASRQRADPCVAAGNCCRAVGSRVACG